MRLVVCAVLAVVGLTAPCGVHAQATTHVDPLHPVYRDLDRLAAGGLIKRVAMSQRPYTRREVARLLAEARENSSKHPNADWAERAVSRWEGEFAPGAIARLAWVEAVDVDVLGMNSPFRPIPPDSTGTIDASINPLVAHRQGRRYLDGQTVSVETRHRLPISRHFAAEIGSRAMGGNGAPARADAEAAALSLERGYVNAVFGNLVVTAGRDALFWGQGDQAGNLVSHNAPPLDMVRISTERPARLPGFLDRVARGPLAGTLFVADLGADRRTPHSRLIGYSVTALPSENFEISIQVLNEQGGRGAPPARFMDRVLDVFIVYDLLSPHRHLDFSNKLSGGSIRLRLPQSWVRGVELYGEGAVDDFDIRRIRSSLVEDGGYVWGVLLSCLPDCAGSRLRAEYRTTGLRYFQHTQFPSGIATRDQVIGNALGPKGRGTYLTWDHTGHGASTFSASAAWEARSGNVYGDGTTQPDHSDFRLVLLERHPTEYRGRVMGSWSSAAPARFQFVGQAGVEHVSNFAFEQGGNRTNVLGRVSVTFRP